MSQACWTLTKIALLTALCLPVPLAHCQQPAQADDAAQVDTPPVVAGSPPVVAHMRLTGPVLESPPEFSLTGEFFPQMTLQDWLHRLADARLDDAVAAVALEIESPQVEWGQAEELAAAIRRLAEVKPVHTYMISGGAMEYILASAGSEMTMEPTGTLDITGLAAELLFFGDALDSIGVQAQLVEVGEYKGAGESLTRNEPSEQLIETYDSLLDDLFEQLLGTIAGHRGLDRRQALAAVNEAPLSAQRAAELGLVDRLLQQAEWRRDIRSQVAPREQFVQWTRNYGHKQPPTINVANPFAIFQMLFGEPTEPVIADPTIAIVHADGVIVSGRSGQGLLGQRLIGARTLATTLDRLADEPNVRAVVLRVNSPGGSAIASETIYQAVRRCAREKPVVASLSSLAASGGYYIALGAPTILADESALTGSVGVVAGKISITGLLEKLNISTHAFTRGENAGLRLNRPWTDRERQVVRQHAERTYDVFVQRLAESRGDRISDLDAVTQGRVFTGRQAARNGLIDGIGGLREAVAAAEQAANVEGAYFLVLPRPMSLAEVLSGTTDEDDGYGARALLESRVSAAAAQLPLISGAQRAGAAYLWNLAAMFQRESIMTVLPLHVTLNK